MAQRFRALASLSEDLGLVLAPIHDSSPPSLTPVPGDPLPLLVSMGTRTYTSSDIHASRTLITHNKRKQILFKKKTKKLSRDLVSQRNFSSTKLTLVSMYQQIRKSSIKSLSLGARNNLSYTVSYHSS